MEGYFSIEIIADFVKSKNEEHGYGFFKDNICAIEFASTLGQNQINKFLRYWKTPKAYNDFISMYRLMDRQLGSLNPSKVTSRAENLNQMEVTFAEMLKLKGECHGD